MGCTLEHRIHVALEGCVACPSETCSGSGAMLYVGVRGSLAWGVSACSGNRVGWAVKCMSSHSRGNIGSA